MKKGTTLGERCSLAGPFCLFCYLFSLPSCRGQKLEIVLPLLSLNDLPANFGVHVPLYTPAFMRSAGASKLLASWAIPVSRRLLRDAPIGFCGILALLFFCAAPGGVGDQDQVRKKGS